MTSNTDPTLMSRPPFAAVAPAQHTALTPAKRGRKEVILQSHQGESLRGWSQNWGTVTRRCVCGCSSSGRTGWTLCVIALRGRRQTTAMHKALPPRSFLTWVCADRSLKSAGLKAFLLQTLPTRTGQPGLWCWTMRPRIAKDPSGHCLQVSAAIQSPSE